ncbi:MAG: HD domain-containing protein [Deltaproteobacteria bacterium]|nr:HD domain-containing protein [Deltaproteobacteria bacterium]
MQHYFKALQEAGGEVYEVGGIVRDRLLARPIGDADVIVRMLDIDRIVSLLTPFGKIALVGQSFGVIKFSPHDDAPRKTIDIALPRKEFSTGVGHRDFQISFDPCLPLEEDLGRRDFTINAMAQNIATGQLIDPFHGQKDLAEKTIRMVFPKAFEEDSLRMLRAIQFAARLHFTIEPETFRSITTFSHLIDSISPERIIEEIRKLMLAAAPSHGFRLMADCGLLERVLPELQKLRGLEQDKRAGDDVFDHTMRVLDAARSDDHLIEPGEIHLMLAALFHDVGKHRTKKFHEPSGRFVFFGHQIVSSKLARKWMQKMKVETIGVNPELVVHLVKHHMFETKASFTERAIRRFIAKIGKDVILKLCDLRLADNRGGKHPHGIKGILRLRARIEEELAKKTPFGPKDLAVNGHDLMSMGIPEGPMLGVIIKALVNRVLDDPSLNTKDQLLALAHDLPSLLKENPHDREEEDIGEEENEG